MTTKSQVARGTYRPNANRRLLIRKARERAQPLDEGCCLEELFPDWPGDRDARKLGR